MTAGTVLADSTSSPRQRRRRWRGMRFSAGEEMQYRESLRREQRMPRTGLFLVLAVGFGLAPFYQGLVFEPSPTILPSLLWMEWAVAALALLATVLSYLTKAPL